MERLTIPDKKIEGGISRTVIDTRAVKEEAMTIYWALKKYEDTGLTPEQIREIDKLYAEQCRELAEYKNANGQELFLRPPCEVGDTIYFIKSAFSLFSKPKEEQIRKIEIVQGDIIIRTENRVFTLEKIGKTVFLTKEEAEAKLAEMEGER